MKTASEKAFLEQARLSLAQAILPAVLSPDDQALAHSFFTVLDDAVESTDSEQSLAAIAHANPDARSLFLESYPVAIIAFTRQATEAEIQNCQDPEDKESLIRFLTFLKKVGLSLAKTLH